MGELESGPEENLLDSLSCEEVLAALSDRLSEEDIEIIPTLGEEEIIPYLMFSLEAAGESDPMALLIDRGLIESDYLHSQEGLDARNTPPYSADELAKREGDDII